MSTPKTPESTASEVELSLEEAVPLGHVLADRLAIHFGFRMLSIKGPVLTQQGLREARLSADVDVWVSPDEFSRAIACFAEAGWMRSSKSTDAYILGRHSETIQHRRWPCEIDIHNRFPGMFVDPQKAFDELWNRRTVVDVGGTAITCTDAAGSAAILGLHDLADGDAMKFKVDELVRVIRETWTPAQVEELGQLATAIGAADTLRPLLEAVGYSVPGVARTDRADLRAWYLRRNSFGQGAANSWAAEIRNTPWRHKAEVISRAVFLTKEELRRKEPELVERPWGYTQARVRRWGRGARQLPSAIRTYLAARRAGS